ncbi:heavy metal translocating P-type ATPase [Helicobacter sp. MIT 14-3879]|uniref:heavy metal translocating P-type ATPase n=1 Tax=Helicobacter sp. MIT 14-3879 TaxID=2040649 RepID=UPI000E1EF849|nr:heavy metal translocating P-type ATPase [Helicobacter sp. MIT 14-3879]RDU62669.1 cadmium-translocating P-type ATPase [Helicobacter sp. MIT 14-3879]
MKKKYIINNISCASCASKIEDKLRKIDFINSISIDTLNNTLEVDLESDVEMSFLEGKIKEIESQIYLKEYIQDSSNQGCDDEKEFNTKKELFSLCYLIGIFIVSVTILYFIDNIIVKNIFIGILVILYIISGREVFINAFRSIKKMDFFDENTLMVTATIAAFFIGAFEEAVAVMLFFRTGEFFQEMAVNNSKKSIKSLLQIAPNIAHLKKDSMLVDVSPKDLNINDIVLVKPGEKIPVDGVVLRGESLLDTKTLTGEPIPKEVKGGDKILGGVLNLNGVLEVKTTKLYKDSSISKIIDLVQNATSNKTKTEGFITKFARIYTPIVFFISLCIAILPPLFGLGDFSTWVYRALVVLMVSCPCALVISVPLAYFGGIGAASKNAILIKGSNYLEALSDVSNIAFDKTGTLTKGTFKITKIVPQNGFSKEEVLQYAFCAENFSNHPIALAIKEEYQNSLNSHQCDNTKFENISGMGIKATCNYKDIVAGNDKILHKFDIEHNTCNVNGSVAHIAVDKVYAGYILIADELKDDSIEAISSLHNLGVEKIIMLTGDNEFASKDIAQKLGLDEIYCNLLPEEKVEIFSKFKANSRGKSIFVGDGINDAPSIAMADVGISMGTLGSDVSKESADVLIVDDKISKIAKTLQIAKKTKTIVWQNIIFAIAIKVLFIILGSFGIASMWEAVFGDVGVALLALFNSMRILKV